MEFLYRYLHKEDLEQVKEFMIARGNSDTAKEWYALHVGNETAMTSFAGEFINGKLTGIMSGCSMGVWFGASEFAPIWVGVRIDRLPGMPGKLPDFMKWVSNLVVDYFERYGYFHHYTARKLPKNYTSNLQLARIVHKSWSHGDYAATVERIIRSQEDINTSPTLFRQMLGPYEKPQVILSVSMPNVKRATRLPLLERCPEAKLVDGQVIIKLDGHGVSTNFRQ